MFKKITYIFLLIFIVTSCADTFDSVKRGMTGAKRQSTDEFMIKKKDPLILPPDFENLPSPDEGIVETEEISTFEKTLSDTIEESSTSSTSSSSVEESIIKKIRKK